MTSVVAVAYSHPTATDMTAHDTRETDDGFIEHRALFNVKEMDR